MIQLLREKLYTKEDGNQIKFSFEKGVYVFFKHLEKGGCVVSFDRERNDWGTFFADYLAKSEDVKIVFGSGFRIVGQSLETYFRNQKPNLKLKMVEKESGTISFYPGRFKLFFGKAEDGIIAKPIDLLPTSRSISSLAANKKGKVKVLVVDDSKTIQTLLKKVFEKSGEIEVVGQATLPSQVMGLIEKTKPDVITLDIHMPEMSGVELLKKHISKTPIPVVMISSISMEEGPLVLEALNCGAVDYIQKPSVDRLNELAPVFVNKVKEASLAKVQAKQELYVAKKTSLSSEGFQGINDGLIVIGSSTGGTQAIETILTNFSMQIPPIVIVQHIPEVFSKAFAERLNGLCPFTVVEAKDGEEILGNKVIVAPGGKQIKFKEGKSGWVVEVNDDAPVNRFKPSVDYFFKTLNFRPKHALGLILTGMGKDGAQGLLHLKNLGWNTLGQDEKSSVVYGMPKVAHEVGAVEKQVGLTEMANAMMQTYNVSHKHKKVS